MAIANYKQIISVNEFRQESPDLSMHPDNVIQTAIYRSSEILNMECNGMIEKVWTYKLSNQNDPTNDLYRTPIELDYLKAAIVTQTAYFIANGNTNNIGSNGFSLDGLSWNNQVPTSRQALAPNVNLYLTQARIYTLWESEKTNTKVCEKDKYKQWQELLSQEHIWSAGDSRYVAKWQEQASNGNIAVVENHNVVFQPLDIALNNAIVNKATNADNVLDTSNNTYTHLENNNWFLQVKAKSEDNSNQIQTLYANFNTLNNNQQQIIAGLSNAGLLTLVGDYNPDKVYKLGNIVTYNSELYVSIINNNNEPLTNTAAWKVLDYKFDGSGYVTSEQFELMSNRVATLENEAAKLNANQTFSGVNTFTKNGEAIKMVAQSNQNNEINFYQNNSAKTGTIKTVGNNTNFYIEAHRGNLVLNCGSVNKILCNMRVIGNLGNPTDANDATNKTYVDNKYNQLSELIVNSNFLKFAGTWSNTTTYEIGNVVSFDNKLWLAKAQNTNSEPSSTNANWEQIGLGDLNVDLSNYYTKPEIDTLLQPIQTNTTNVVNEVNRLSTEVSNKVDTSYLTSNYYDRTYINNNYPINQIVKKNENNTFTQAQTISNSNALLINNNAILSQIRAQGEKKVVLYKAIQPTSGFRNYAVMTMEVQNGNTVNEVLKIQSRDTNQGIFIKCEANKLNFIENTSIGGINNPVGNNDAANKIYVDTADTNLRNSINSLTNRFNGLITLNSWQTYTRTFNFRISSQEQNFSLQNKYLFSGEFSGNLNIPLTVGRWYDIRFKFTANALNCPSYPINDLPFAISTKIYIPQNGTWVGDCLMYSQTENEFEFLSTTINKGRHFDNQNITLAIQIRESK